MIEAYQQRFVALEVFYLGWRYHGFASQCETDGTVEVQHMLSYSLTSASSGLLDLRCVTSLLLSQLLLHPIVVLTNNESRSSNMAAPTADMHHLFP